MVELDNYKTELASLKAPLQEVWESLDVKGKQNRITELDKMMEKPLNDRQLHAAKRQLKGQIAIACDNREQFAFDFAKHFLHYGQERDITHLLQRVEAITATQLQDVAQDLFAPNHLQQLTL